MRKQWRKVFVSVCVFIGLLYPGNMMYLVAEDGEMENETSIKESVLSFWEEIEIVDSMEGNLSFEKGDMVPSIEELDAASDESTNAEVVADVTTVEANIDPAKQRQIRVALIDTGVDTTSELLQRHIAEGYDASNMSDVNGHGTLMAEIIASNTNENVKIVPYQIFDENGKATVGATYYALLKAINDEVDVISLSVSGYGTSNMLTSAIAKAKEAGIYVVVAAGNDGDNADEFMPGNISDAITVSAVSIGEDGNKTLAAYSNHGSVVDYSALGTIVKDRGTEDISDDKVYEGTSISAANVSSYIATVLQYIKDDESTENDEVLDALNSTVEDFGEAGRDDSFGVGYLSFEGIGKFIAEKTQLEEEIEESSSNEEDVTENDDTTATEESAEEYPDADGKIEFDEKDEEQLLNVAMTKKTFSIELQNFRAGGYLELWGGEDVFTNGVPTDIKNLGKKVTYTAGTADMSYNWPAGGTFSFRTSGNTVYVSMNNVDISNTTPYLSVHFGNNDTSEFYATQKLTYGASGSTGAKQYDSKGNFKYDITANNANAQRVAPTIVGQCDLFTYIGESYSISAWRCNRIKYTAKWENWVDSDTNKKVNEVTDCEATIGFTINISGDVDTVKSVEITGMSGSTAKPTVSSPFNGTIFELNHPKSADVGNGIQRKKDGKTLYCTTYIEDLLDYTTYNLKYKGKIKIKIKEKGQSSDTVYSDLPFNLPDKSFTTKINNKIEELGGSSKYTPALQLLRKSHTYSAITIDTDGTIGISKDHLTIGGAAKDSTVDYTYKGNKYKCVSYSNANNLTINYSKTIDESKIKFTDAHYISIPTGKSLKVNGKKESDGTFLTSIVSDSTVFSSGGSLEVSKCKLAGGNNKAVIDSKANSSLTISNSEIKNYSSDSKGSYGIKNAGTATVTKCMIHGNSGGGIHNSKTLTIGGGLADMRIYGNGGYGIVNSGIINATALSLGFSTWTSQSAFAISTNHGGINNSGTFNATENIRIYQNGTAHGINNSGTFNNKLANYANGTAPSINIYKSRTSGVADDTGISMGYQNTAGGKYVDSSTTTATPLIIMGIMKEGVHNAGPNTEKNLPGGSFSAKKVTINGNYCLASGNTAWSTTTSSGISSNGVWNGGSMNLPSVSITGTGTSADGLENTGTINSISGTITGGKIGVYNESGTIGNILGTVTGGISGITNKGTIKTLSANVTGTTKGIHNDGVITHTSGIVAGGTWGLWNRGTYTQTGGNMKGNSANIPGSCGGVYQNGIYNISGVAQVTVGDVYLCSKKMINVNGSLTGTSQVASIDSADNTVGTVLVNNTFQTGTEAQDTCEAYVNGKTIRFVLSKNLTKAKTTSEDGTEVKATYNRTNSEHKAVLRAGQGIQNTPLESNNPEVMNKSFTNGAEGTLVLSCYLDVTYDLSKVEELTGLRAGIYDEYDKLTCNYNSNIWKEGFITSDTEFNTYSNNNNYEVKLESSKNALDVDNSTPNLLSNALKSVNSGADVTDVFVPGKEYYANNKSEGSDSYTFLGWCLQEDGSGYVYTSPTSFPIGNNYTWYPIFDVSYSIEYNSNYASPDRSDLGGQIYFDTYDKGSSTERKTESIETKDMTSMEEDTFFKITTKDEDTHSYSTYEVIGNTGPSADMLNYWNKKIETTHLDSENNIDEDYTYWYQFIGWSLDKTSNFTDFSNSDVTKKVYTTSNSENFMSAKEAYVKNHYIVNNSDRLARWEFKKNHWDLVQVKEADNQSLLYVTMYAIWDEYPEIFAEDFTVMSNDAILTNADTFQQAVIDHYVFTKDYETIYKSDENLIVTVDYMDYDAIKSIGYGGKDIGMVSVTVKVADEVGNESYDTCEVTIISNSGITSSSDGENSPLYVRFVDEKNWLKNDFWKIIFDEGNLSIGDFVGSDTESQKLATIGCLCDAYRLWLTQTGVSPEVAEMLKESVDDETITSLQSLDSSQTNLQRVMNNTLDDGAMEPYSKWYLNPQLVLDIHEAFELTSNPLHK